MSGTSADAIDAALVNFSQSQPTIVGTYSLPLPEKIKDSVHQLAISGSNEIDKLQHIDQNIALYSCEAIQTLCLQAHIDKKTVRAIGSHGQTIRHQPPKHEQLGYSLQAGDPNIIAQQTGITTVADFRRRDIAAGGHGAPLAPAFHNQIFRSTEADRIIVNLGGIANITLVNDKKVIGYDTGPANGLMDSWCQLHLQQPFDKDGNWASNGQCDTQLLTQLLNHPFFSEGHPKSTGRESFNLPWLEKHLHQLRYALQPVDVQATLMQLTIESLSQAIEIHDPQGRHEIYLCGGGAYNSTLVEHLKKRLTPRIVSTTDDLGIAPEWVEAVAFAWLAQQTINRAAGNLPSVTGAHHEVILGAIYPA